MQIIGFTVGDWSDDGHGKTSTFFYEVNMPKEQVEKAYYHGVKDTGIDLINEVCCDYEDNRLQDSIVDKLQKLGWANLVENPKWVNADEFVQIYLHIAKTGSGGKLEWRFLPDPPEITVGGYGLFH